MFENPLFLFLAAAIPLVVGAVWYGPLFGKSWIKVNNFTDKDLEGGNMAVIFGLTYLLSIFLAFGLSNLTNHQSGLVQLFVTHPDFGTEGSEVQLMFNEIMSKFGDRHRHFGHGAFHGVLGAILFALPLIGINAMFERRGAKYIGIHFGYWVVSLAIMGGVICQWL